MSRFAFLSALIALGFAAPQSAMAQVPLASSETASNTSSERLGGPLGLGVALGSTTGLAGKFWLNDNAAVQFGFGGRLGVTKDLTMSADYVLQSRPINVEGDDYAIPVHVGAGVWSAANFAAGASGEYAFGPRLVAGFSVLVPDLPVDLHVEVAPTFLVVEKLGWSMNGQIGMRYYF